MAAARAPLLARGSLSLYAVHLSIYLSVCLLYTRAGTTYRYHRLVPWAASQTDSRGFPSSHEENEILQTTGNEARKNHDDVTGGHTHHHHHHRV
ncbi:hypothetical protein F4780DRAFT_752807 [Xylariomycetidae sp. FL0641]|nr:hypothetical protein F4780DRAFT_752807 [Xylariomycetidae sp. FL0641]